MTYPYFFEIIDGAATSCYFTSGSHFVEVIIIIVYVLTSSKRDLNIYSPGKPSKCRLPQLEDIVTFCLVIIWQNYCRLRVKIYHQLQN